MNVDVYIFLLSVLFCNLEIIYSRIHHFRSTLHSTPKYVRHNTPTNFSVVDFNNHTKKDSLGRECNFKIASWNVNGIRTIVRRDYFEYIKLENPDVFCIQKLECMAKDIPANATNITGYNFYSFTNESTSVGVAIYSKEKAQALFRGVNHPKRYRYANVITAEYEEFFMVSAAALPPSGKVINVIRRLFWDGEFLKLLLELDKIKPVIIAGSLLVARSDLDVHRHLQKKNLKGLDVEERDSLKRIIRFGFNDTFRLLYPKANAIYTYWSSTRDNLGRTFGKRVDYFLVSHRLSPCLCDNIIRTNVYGSRHYPMVLYLHL